MADIPPVLVRIQADVDQLKSGLRDAETSLKAFDGDVKRANSAVGGFGDTVKKLGATLGVTFAVGGLVNFFRSSVDEAMKAEAAMTRLRELLLTTGGATEVQIQALEKQADALAKVGAASKDSIVTTQSQLATFDLTGKTINTLTPAILDYVAAEKGAAATTEDYKMMTNGLAQALQGNFTSLTRVGFVLDEATKKQIASGTESERAAALVQVLNSTYKGFNETLAKTPQGRMMKLKQEFNEVKETVGQALMPVIEGMVGFISTSVLPAFSTAADFVKNLTTSLTGGGSLGEGFRKITTDVKNFLKPLADMAKSLAGPGSLMERFKDIAKFIKDFYTPIVMAMREAMTKVRDTIIANRDKIKELLDKFREIFAWVNQYIVPLFKTVLVAAIKQVGTVISTTFNLLVPLLSGVLDGIKIAINGVIWLINKMITAYNAVAGALGKKPVSYIDEIGAQAKRTTTALDQLEKSGARVAKTVSTPVDLFDRQGGGGDVFAGTPDKAGGPTKEDKARAKKLDALRKKVRETVKDMQDVVKEAQERADEALGRRGERVAEAEARYYETLKDIRKRYTDTMERAQERRDDAEAEAQIRKDKTDLKARQRHAQDQIEIARDYLARSAELEKDYQDRQTDIRKSGENKRLELIRSAAEKQASIVKQSIDRLRAAFASKTGVDIASAFTINSTELKRSENGLISYVRKISDLRGSVSNLISDLKSKLAGAKELQANAAALAALGYSQTFIEEIVKAGPEAGNAMAKALKSASPETTKELQALYGQMETLTETGLDSLAAKMNAGGKLATSELTDAYKAVATDLQASLAAVNREVDNSLLEAQTSYTQAVDKLKADRDRRLDESLEQLKDSLKESQEAFDDAMEDAKKTFERNRKDAQKSLQDSLTDARDVLQKALIAAQKDYEDQIDQINKSTEKKLTSLRENLAEIAKTMSSLSAAKDAQAALAAGGSVGTGIVKKKTAPVILLNTVDREGNEVKSEPKIAVTVNGYNLTSPQATANATTSAIKYGQAVLVGGTTIRAPQAMLEGLGGPIK